MRFNLKKRKRKKRRKEQENKRINLKMSQINKKNA